MLNCRRRYCCMNNSFFNSNCSNNLNNNDIETNCPCSNSDPDYNTNCSCGFDDDTQDVFPENPMLAQSYVPVQFMNETLKPCSGLSNGTIFPELISPYSPCDNMRDNAYIESTNIPKEGCNSCRKMKTELVVVITQI